MSASWIEIVKPSISPFLIVTWAATLKYWYDKRLKTSESQHPKKIRTKILTLLFRIAVSPFGLPLICVAENIYFLRQELLRTDPLTRWGVFEIANDTGFIFIGFALMAAMPYVYLTNMAHSLFQESFTLMMEQLKEIAVRDKDELG